jgi:hypothetical protein
VVVVADEVDCLAAALRQELRQRACSVRQVTASQLAALRVNVSGSQVLVEGTPISGLIFRARSDGPFSQGFAEADADFCANEARAAWLSALQLPGLFVLNRPDAEVWYSASEWSVWHRRFEAAGLPVVPLAVGALPGSGGGWWLPWGGGVATPPGPAVRRTFAAAVADAGVLSRNLCCYGESIDGPEEPVIEAVCRVLSHYGISLATVTTDEQGRVVSCSTQPEVPDLVAPKAAHRISEAWDVHLRRG